MEEGTIVEYRVKVGDEVGKGDVIFDVETDKATLEVESPAAGFVKVLLVEAGTTLPVDAPVLVLGKKDEDVPRDFIDSLKGPAPAAAAQQQQPPEQQQPAKAVPAPAPGKVIASPRAKRLAAELGVDLATVTGTGPGGKITEDDVKAASKEGAAPQGEIRLGSTVPLSRIQRITGQKMLKSKQEIPCFYLNVKADVTDLVKTRNRINEKARIRVSYNDFIVLAAAAALEKFPLMTGQIEGGSIRLADQVNVGLAISVGDDLVAPILKNVREKDIGRIAADRQALVEKAQSNKLSPDDLEGGCITVSNLGGLGVDAFTPIVVPGQCSILGVGKIADTVVPNGDGGKYGVRKLVNFTLAVDHRIANGAYAAQFLEFLRQMLEDASTFDK
jgi:pyruvate dehydrogenase E2 component (dihydrolipoamide acetyltransferase)